MTGSESASSMKREPHVGHCAWNEQRTVRHTLHTKPRVMGRRWQKQIAAVAPRSASRPSSAPSPGSRSIARHRFPVWQQHCAVSEQSRVGGQTRAHARNWQVKKR